MSSDTKVHKATLAFVFGTGPVLALAMQSLLYADVPWACRGGSLIGLHVIAAVFTALVAITVVAALRLWKSTGRGVRSAANTVNDRARFVALSGLALSLASLLLILAMWVPVFVFDPCVR